MVDNLLQQWQFERLSGAAPHFVFPTILGDHHSAQSVFGRRPWEEEEEEVTDSISAFYFFYILLFYSTVCTSVPEVVVRKLLQCVWFHLVTSVLHNEL